MRSLWIVFRKEFFENLRDRRILLAALVFGPVLGPALLAGVLQLSVTQGETAREQPLTLPVVGAESAPTLMAVLQSQGITVDPVALDEPQIRAAIAARDMAVVLQVPADFAERWSRAEPAPLQLFFDRSDQFGGEAAAARVGRVLEAYGSSIAQSRLLLRGIDPLTTAVLAVQEVDVSTPLSRASLALGMLSYLTIFAMLFGGLYLAIDTTAGERERGSLESLLMAPVARRQLIYGKIAATTSYMLISLALTLVACALSLQFVQVEQFGLSIDLSATTVLKLFAVTAPLALFGAGLLTVVASFTRSFREAQSYLTFAISLPTLPLAFISLLQVDSSALALATPSLGQHLLMMRILRGETLLPIDFAISVGASLLLGALLCAIAGRLYEREAILG